MNDSYGNNPVAAASAATPVSQFDPPDLHHPFTPSPPPPAPPVLQFNSSAAKGFIGSLFDFSFNHFITGKLVKFLYFIFIALSAIATVAIIMSAFGAGASFGSRGMSTLLGLLALVVSPIIFLVVVTYARVALELVMVLFKIEEHLAARGQ